MHTVLLVGSGRLSRHLVYWNSLQKSPLKFHTWNRQSHTSEELQSFLKKADFVWLAISDSALVSFFEQNLSHIQIPVVHFSGALHDARMISAHPLMSFPEQLMNPEVYPKIHFALTGVSTLQQALPYFQNSFSLIDEKQKAFYHALCVVAGNFPQFLWSETLSEFERLQIPSVAVDAYIQQVATNFIQLKSKALTGPLIRQDTVTIEKNINSLEKSKLQKIYSAFAEVFTK